ncbi:5-(carboxyamino)imidazole ribonucleotide synthase [Sphingomonas sp.]|uniref:5-(carboxyamino)imidazole ribonucleotide synthase n=1 Tax=Sphingomonas sp. TaxID=28214 RepID=UPI002ED7BEA7
MTAIPPGSTIGILGSGQLGRMLAVAAAQLGYRCHIYAPESGPACDVAAAFTQGDYNDATSLAAFAKAVDIVTYEFENVDPRGIAHLAPIAPVRPGSRALDISRERPTEKGFVRDQGGTTAPFREVTSLAGLEAAVAEIGVPSILKTSMFGYDGKGQARLASPDDATAAWETVGGQPSVLESFVTFAHEFSIMLVRGLDGATVHYPAPLNVHRDGILATSTIPAPALVQTQVEAAVALTTKLAHALDYVGVLTCEFFATADGPVFNEMAPRVHNSGHWTIEGAVTSQFENHIRAICGLPLGSTALTGASVEMDNLIGDEADQWPALLAEGDAHLHLYGKHEARPGRKMGHVTRVWR